MHYKVGQQVKVNKDIHRVEDPHATCPYAVCGETGIIIEIFRPIPTGGGEIKPLYAKVNIEGKIKTFRLTSLDHC